MDEEVRGYPYDVALSFAGEDRGVVQKLANALERESVKVFYDEWSKAELWGKDLYQHLDHVYREAAQFCIIFISSDYVKKAWTRHELRSAQARAFKENREYILPVRLDDTEVPGLPDTVGYIDLRQHGVEDLARLVLAKLKGQSDPSLTTNNAVGSKFRIPRLPRTDIDPAQGARRLIADIARVWDERTEVLESAGLKVHKSHREDKLQYEVKKSDRLVYFFRVMLDPSGKDGALSFHDGWNYPIEDNASMALGTIEHRIDQREPVVVLFNFSLIKDATGVSLTLSFPEFIERVWEKACSTIEAIAPQV